MRRTLTGLVVAAALIVPAYGASAAPGDNASCNSGTQKGAAGSGWNQQGTNNCGPAVQKSGINY